MSCEQHTLQQLSDAAFLIELRNEDGVLADAEASASLRYPVGHSQYGAPDLELAVERQSAGLYVVRVPAAAQEVQRYAYKATVEFTGAIEAMRTITYHVRT